MYNSSSSSAALINASKIPKSQNFRKQPGSLK